MTASVQGDSAEPKAAQSPADISGPIQTCCESRPGTQPLGTQPLTIHRRGHIIYCSNREMQRGNWTFAGTIPDKWAAEKGSQARQLNMVCGQTLLEETK